MTILAEQQTTGQAPTIPVECAPNPAPPPGGERGTLDAGFLPDQTITEEGRAWAAATLGDLPTVIHFPKKSVRVDRDEIGMLFRKAFAICVTPGYRFSINLYAGASPSDLKHAERLIERARQGWFNSDLWESTTFRDSGRSGYVLKCYWQWDGLEDIDEIRPCTMPGCINQYHEYRNGEFNEAHRAGEDIETEHYDISLSNYEDEDGWHAYLSLDNDWPTGPEGLKILRDAANDYAWMQAEADKLNALASEVGA